MLTNFYAIFAGIKTHHSFVVKSGKVFHCKGPETIQNHMNYTGFCYFQQSLYMC